MPAAIMLDRGGEGAAADDVADDCKCCSSGLSFICLFVVVWIFLETDVINLNLCCLIWHIINHGSRRVVPSLAPPGGPPRYRIPTLNDE